MANGTIDEFKTRFDCLFTDFFDFIFVAESFDMLVRTEFEINFVGVIDKFLRLIRSDELRKLAAYLV